MLANGHPRLLGFPSIVKSCSKGDSEIDGIIELPASMSSADGPDQIFTPAEKASGGLGGRRCKAIAALVAACTVSAADFEASSVFWSSICGAVCGIGASACVCLGDELRLRGGVTNSLEPHILASSLYCGNSRQLEFIGRVGSGKRRILKTSQSQFERNLSTPQAATDLELKSVSSSKV